MGHTAIGTLGVAQKKRAIGLCGATCLHSAAARPMYRASMNGEISWFEQKPFCPRLTIPSPENANSTASRLAGKQNLCL
jgi:hypothetical protein